MSKEKTLRGGKRKGAGRKSAPYQTDTISFRVRVEWIPEIKKLVKERIAGLKSNGWISVKDYLPDHLKLVWLTNGKGWVSLGCRVVTEDGWHWAESNGVVYSENGKIVAECESDDLDVVLWHDVPELVKV